ncbi:NAD(P)H dehydrogenase (quinone) [Paenibacillus curdlanolyticus YK9]|uniref:FMN dependent NADH:quinone oxidoreductase n=1 Tax=Paenibacillus curdlanolyticus YK9 TaxID=717606 RepID=E0I680_9BACL|nr:FMN-dependent NADH-azoreductase [Paenibacillus curdlanolyticus]EFM12472.1 NAD(P)H dehydrogenase (quinone) [Paenibacillus curdlanolyticus YK9]
MATVLMIKANDRPAEQAVSVQLYDAFVQSYKETHPADTVVELDLYAENLPFYGNEAITAMFKSAQGFELSAEEKRAADTVNKYLDQFIAADKVAIAFPLWNFTAPAPLINYIGYIAQAGKTFKYTAEGPVGLLNNKPVVLLSARGGVYSEGPMVEFEAAVRPVKAALGLFGAQTQEVIIEGHNQFRDRAADIIAEGLKKAADTAAAF